MKRRTLLLGGAGIAAAAGVGVLWKPGDEGAPHDAYFSALNELLKRDGPGRPVMLIDVERMRHNIDSLTASVGPDKTYRVVVKSLPSVPLLERVMARAKTTALMVFHQPFLNAVAQSFPESDALLGKPMPVAAARTYFGKLHAGDRSAAVNVQWLIDSAERLAQYRALARQLGVKLRVNLEIDVGLHRGGLQEPQALTPILDAITADPEHLELSGFMGYEPHLTGLAAGLDHPAVQSVLSIYRGFIDAAKQAGVDVGNLTLNGAGSHTLKIYQRDATMNDLAAGSGVVMPTDFDTHHLAGHRPALFIATPILKRYDGLRVAGDPLIADVLSAWDPNMRRLYYIYGGYWKARVVSPAGVGQPIYESTNQSPVTTSTAVDLQVDDYMFLRPTQSEHVMLQFGDLLAVSGGEISERWPVFHQTG
ncbi:MAG: DSD1 family PLP-dependent enzyme [Pseudomonadales bacterium]|jgi:D-serine deaminase-like pyridoxal phosphate-dependent protein|nr:DSD1 family PLP-dependent enzyme [Pseudomonadales bacterium]MDP6469606.1 DSD1 family PLP-dependent enzyme [Pseudomonadales bacterium]MDP6827447.1 DSD1 family PLP-dependent enzyme [Pseudomonadales bacterium]MDP6972191.1 DSD1 family PLP-dependent enzyme [Pseudomonadales bacterium]